MYGVNNQHFVTWKLEVIEPETLPIRITKPPGGITTTTDFQLVTIPAWESNGVFLPYKRYQRKHKRTQKTPENTGVLK